MSSARPQKATRFGGWEELLIKGLGSHAGHPKEWKLGARKAVEEFGRGVVVPVGGRGFRFKENHMYQQAPLICLIAETTARETRAGCRGSGGGRWGSGTKTGQKEVKKRGEGGKGKQICQASRLPGVPKHQITRLGMQQHLQVRRWGESLNRARLMLTTTGHAARQGKPPER